MKSLEIEKLLQRVAPPATEPSKTRIDQVHARIVQSTSTVSHGSYFVFGIVFLLALLGSLFLMVAMAVPGWMIAVSFGSSIALTLIFALCVNTLF